jgi:hypothetical protein
MPIIIVRERDVGASVVLSWPKVSPEADLKANQWKLWDAKPMDLMRACKSRYDSRVAATACVMGVPSKSLGSQGASCK